MLHTSLVPKLQRSNGSAIVGIGPACGRKRIERLSQAGSAKVFVLGLDEPVPEIVLVNTSGGLASGDSLSFELAAQPDTRLTATTQAAERAYKALDIGAQAPAHAAVTIRVGARGRVDWLPQETILYDRAALRRRTEVDLAHDAACLLAETTVLGRPAMGERVTRLDLEDRRIVRRDGRPVWAETLRIDGEALDVGKTALLGQARAFGIVALVARGAEDALGAVRQVLGEDGVEAAASAWDGKCVVRIAGTNGWPVRQQVARVSRLLAGGTSPRVWQSEEGP